MSQRQKSQQAARQPPPSGPNGELRFQPDVQNLAQEHDQGEKVRGITPHPAPSALDRALKLDVRRLSCFVFHTHYMYTALITKF